MSDKMSRQPDLMTKTRNYLREHNIPHLDGNELCDLDFQKGLLMMNYEKLNLILSLLETTQKEHNMMRDELTFLAYQIEALQNK